MNASGRTISIYTRSAGVRIGKADILADLRAVRRRNRRRRRRLPPRTSASSSTATWRSSLSGSSARRAAALLSVDDYLNTGTFAEAQWRMARGPWQATRVPAKEAEVNLTPGPTARAGLHDEIRRGRRALQGVLRHLRHRGAARARHGRLRDVRRQGRSRADLGRGIRAGGAGQVQAPGGWHRFHVDRASSCWRT